MIKRIRHFLAAILLAPAVGVADTVPVLDEVQQLAPASEVFFEPYAREDMFSITQEPFSRVSSEFAHFPQNSGSYWLRFTLENSSNADLQRIISFDYPHVTAARLYTVRDGAMVVLATHAAQMPLAQRAIVNRYPSLLFEIPRHTATQMYLNIRLQGKANQALEYQMRLYPVERFFSLQMASYTVLIGFIGFMASLLIYNLLLYTRVGIRGYLYYSLYLVAQITALMAFEGLFYLLPSPPSVATVVVLTTISPMLCAFFLIHFGRDILELQDNLPLVNRLLHWVGVALLIMMTMAALGATWINLAMELVGVLTIVSLAILALLVYRRGSKAALFFAISFAFLVLGYSTELFLYSIPTMTSSEPLLPPAVLQWVERYFYYSCAAIEMVFLSLALASYIVQIRDEKEWAQRVAIENLQERHRVQDEYSTQLEHDIAQRTQEIVEQSELLAAQASELQRVDDLKSRFFTNLSHEFRTPLTLIRGPVQNFLAGDYGDLQPKAREVLEITSRNVERLYRLINELLVLAELESGALKLQSTEVDLRQFCRRTAALFTHTAKERDIELEMELTEQPLLVFFDEDKLEKVLCNLLSNAFKYSPQGSRVKLSMSVTDDEQRSTGTFATLSIEDEGPGIDEANATHVFDRFYRTDSAQEQFVEGSGIGLALVKELVELHGGHVAVRNRLSQSGSVFSISLPLGLDHLGSDEIVYQTLAMPRAAQEVGASPENEELRGGGILVVEDNADMRNYLVSLLAGTYQVYEAANGLLALEVLEAQSVELVLSDVMMPELDGIGLLDKIRQHEKWQVLPVILLTARSDDESRLQGLRARADEFLAKPFRTEELLLKIDNLLRRAHAPQQSLKPSAFVPVDHEQLASTDQEFLARATQIAQTHLAEHEFDVAALADGLHMSLSTLRRRMEEAVALTPAQFIRQLRLQQAHHYIESNHFRTLAETAYAVGFNQPGYFSRLYKQYLGSLSSD